MRLCISLDLVSLLLRWAPLTCVGLTQDSFKPRPEEVFTTRGPLKGQKRFICPHEQCQHRNEFICDGSENQKCECGAAIYGASGVGVFARCTGVDLMHESGEPQCMQVIGTQHSCG